MAVSESLFTEQVHEAFFRLSSQRDCRELSVDGVVVIIAQYHFKFC
jgi:hypothetical protein